MPSSLMKSIDARKLNPRTLTVVSGPEVTIPFSAIVDHVERDRDMVRFRYLNELYTCPYERLEAALDQEDQEAPAPAPASKIAEPRRAVPRVSWRQLESSGPAVKRAKVPGGWLVLVEGDGGVGLTFYADASHSWDGGSLPDPPSA